MSAIAMPRIIKAYVRYVDAVNRVLGYFVMYLTLVIMAVLLFGQATLLFARGLTAEQIAALRFPTLSRDERK